MLAACRESTPLRRWRETAWSLLLFSRARSQKFRGPCARIRRPTCSKSPGLWRAWSILSFARRFFRGAVWSNCKRSPCRWASFRNQADRRARILSAWHAEIFWKDRHATTEARSRPWSPGALPPGRRLFPTAVRGQRRDNVRATSCSTASRAPSDNSNRLGLRRPTSMSTLQDRTSAAKRSTVFRARSRRAVGLCRWLR